MEEKSGRKHSLFTKLKLNPLADLDRKKMHKWIDKKKQQIIKPKSAMGEGNLSDSDATDDDNVDDSDTD